MFKEHGNIFFIGSGSSYHAGLIAASVCSGFSDKHFISIPSSEFVFYHDYYLKNLTATDFFIIFSRTGETSDTLMAAEIIKDLGGRALCLTTFKDTSISRICDKCIVLKHCRENSITSTRAVTGFTLFILSLFFSLYGRQQLVQSLINKSSLFFKKFKLFSDTIFSILYETDISRYVFLGHGPFYGVAREAALKVREMSLVSTEFWRTLEYRHGHSTLIDKNTLSVLFLSDMAAKLELKTCVGLRESGAKILLIFDNKSIEGISRICDWYFDTGMDLESSTLTIPFQLFGQLLGYHQALKKGINPSRPRGLEYVVTI
jgi:glucosamine--fructose-6-phosphate aminotransferase (isomerizing)